MHCLGPCGRRPGVCFPRIFAKVNTTRRVSRCRWFVVGVLFLFILLHQTDRLMIGPMQDTIERQFSIDDQQWGLINSGAWVALFTVDGDVRRLRSQMGARAAAQPR